MNQNQHLRNVNRRLRAQLPKMLKKMLLMGAIVACLLPQSLLAAVTSNVTAGVLEVSSDAGDAITVTCDALNVQVNGSDPNSGAALCATITEINVLGGPNENLIDLNTVATTDFTLLTTVTVDGLGASDVITGSFLDDTLSGGEGNDRVVGHRGADTMNGDGGEDTLVWNPGDGSDIANGGSGDDTMEVNGGGGGETFIISSTLAGVLFQRTSAVAFNVEIDPSTENLELNANGGDDVITGTTDLSGLITMTINGGDGNDRIRGGDGDDLLNGDGDNDFIVGFQGSDDMIGGDGDDTMVWNPGDGSDFADGGIGDDTMVVNGGGLSETFTISATGSFVRFDRVEPIPFSVDIDPSTENLELNGNGGGDVVTGTADLSGVITMTINGGPGDDRIRGGDGDDTLNGDGDNDFIVGFQGSDEMNGGDGDDTMVWNPGDGSDFADGGIGDDTMVVNGGGVSETFTISATGSFVRFDRVEPIPFSVDIDPTTEKLELNGNGGGDVVTGTEDLSGVITMTINGGAGDDLIKGGDGVDTLNGDAGNDTVIGFRGNDVMNGGPDNDTLVWNNGDGSDVMDGGDGDDTVVVNGGALSETFAITPVATAMVAGVDAPLVGSVFFQRVTPGPFSLDIEAESVEVNGNDGDDTFNVTPLPNTTIHYEGGAQVVADVLRVDAQRNEVVETLGQIAVDGRQPVTFGGVEEVEIINSGFDLQLLLPQIRWND